MANIIVQMNVVSNIVARSLGGPVASLTAARASLGTPICWWQVFSRQRRSRWTSEVLQEQRISRRPRCDWHRSEHPSGRPKFITRRLTECGGWEYPPIELMIV